MTEKPFKLNYSTMFDPPEALHQAFEAALATVRGRLGGACPMWVGGRARGGAGERLTQVL